MAESTLIKFPSNLPAPLLSDHSLKQQSNLLRTKMDSGHARVRRRFKSVPTVMGTTWHCNKNDALGLEWFVTHQLNWATAYFVMGILTPNGIIEHEVRFITSPLEEYKPIGGGWWEYKAQIEIKHRVILDEQQTVEAIFAPNTPTQFTDGVKAAVDSYQE
jgi:hypothetical protein